MLQRHQFGESQMQNGRQTGNMEPCDPNSTSKPNPPLTYMHINVHSLLPKLDLINFWIHSTDTDILVLSETWLNISVWKLCILTKHFEKNNQLTVFLDINSASSTFHSGFRKQYGIITAGLKFLNDFIQTLDSKQHCHTLHWFL